MEDMKVRAWVAFGAMCIAAYLLSVGPALAQTRSSAVTIRYAAISPFVALLAGILILIMPRLLNFIVAIYLILIGLIGILGG
jgi:hypothetical protein